METWRQTPNRTGWCAIVDHGISQADVGLQALENDGMWVTARKGQQVRVLTGRAWVTLNGRDYILGPGERLDLGIGGDRAIVSGLNRGLMMLEVDLPEPVDASDSLARQGKAAQTRLRDQITRWKHA